MKTRIITGVFLAVLTIMLTLKLSSGLFASVTLLVMLLAWSEWHHLGASINGQDALTYPQAYLQTWFVGVIAFFIAALLFWIWPFLSTIIIALGALYWGGQVVHLLKTRRFQRWFANQYNYLGMFLLVAAWAALVQLHAQSPLIALGAMLVVWVADSAAYFTGRRFGEKSLAAHISPNKTREGAYGGVICAAILSFFYALFILDGLNAKVLVWVIATVVAAIVSIAGDLFESQLKRQAGVKDSSQLLPGHGGVLDRVDGLLAAMPVLLIIWLILS